LEFSNNPSANSFKLLQNAALNFAPLLLRLGNCLNVAPPVTPMIHTNHGNSRSATVNPFHVE